VSLGSAAQLDAALGWKTRQWLSTTPYSREYLTERVGDEEDVLVETRRGDDGESSNDADQTTFGFSLSSGRRVVKMHDLLREDFTGTVDGRSEQRYLNIQPARSGEGKYRSPLHKLTDDIPPPLSMMESAWSNVTDVSLWMGRAETRDAQSRLHMDATDNLYVLLEGTKQFSVLSPAHALHTQTVSPTYAVSEDGLSFQFNANRFRQYHQKSRLQSQQGQNGEQVEVGTDGSSETITVGEVEDNMVASITRDSAQYGVSNNHFSTLSTAALTAEDGDTDSEDDNLNAVRAQLSTFELQAGDMLYLPTGWFHQVTSRQGPHMAVNYWWRALNWKDAKEFESKTSGELYEKLIKKYTTI
jgi:hypothetical protein